ncbi:glycosyl transferase [Patiriisocius marinistellae]|uniref:Glycosyl transferase n=1 Tax=Patiriisocius marinistellae TaxID=2494560 RepID=A0A5J4FVS9_9FLAO|nr:glycosyltransferase [Patiriisocius marinistellae]GEQ86797.1 glycosyl transferase [Patiriisocius marinistellae]
MRVLQLIDNLDAGGAERVAVTFANTLHSKIDFSAIAVTRKEGILNNTLDKNVPYLFIKKKGTFDLKALSRLKKYVKENNVDIVHAHTTSYFFATLLKLRVPRLKLIWHEHQGNRVHTSRINNKVLYGCSKLFSGILTVNEPLKKWCLTYLSNSKVEYIPNFVSVANISEEEKRREQSIVCVANLKEPKNHINLLRAFKIVNAQFPYWNLKLIGKDFNDTYSQNLKDFVKLNKLTDNVTFKGVVANVNLELKTALIGVLSSSDEGLPMALLEYGAFGLAVVCTNVGQCPKVIGTFGKIVENDNCNQLAQALIEYINDLEMCKYDSKLFREHILANYGLKTVVPQLLTFYKSI